MPLTYESSEVRKSYSDVLGSKLRPYQLTQWLLMVLSHLVR